MVPFNLQLELNGKLTTFSVEQLDQLADDNGFMRYQVRTFHLSAVIYVNIENDPHRPEDIVGFSKDEVFTPEEIKVIAASIREYTFSRALKFDQMSFNF